MVKIVHFILHVFYHNKIIEKTSQIYYLTVLEVKSLKWAGKAVFLPEALAQLLSHVQLFATPWTVVHHAPLSMWFSRQEYWSGLPFPSPGDPPDPGTEPTSPALAGWYFMVWATREGPTYRILPFKLPSRKGKSVDTELGLVFFRSWGARQGWRETTASKSGVSFWERGVLFKKKVLKSTVHNFIWYYNSL